MEPNVLFASKALARFAPSALAATALVAFGLRAVTAATAPPPGRTIVVGCDAFVHGPNWELVRGRKDGRLGGSSLRSLHPGARATLDFEGTGVRLFGVLGKGGGLAVITLDGTTAYVVTFFALEKATHRQVFASKRLARGKHHLTIEVAKMPHDRNALPGYVNIDGADVRL